MPKGIDFRAGDVPTLPYDLAKKVWDDRMGSATMQARAWRRMAFVMGAVTAAAVAGSVYLGSLPKTVPYIVSLDDSRAAVNVLRLRRTEVKDADVRYFIQMFVTWIRTVSVDPAVIQSNYKQAFGFTSKSGAAILKTHLEKFQPFERAKQETRTVRVRTINPMAGDTWQVRWEETVYDLDGNEEGKLTYVGMTTIRRETPTEDTILKNPLGIYITGFNFQEDIKPQ
jgi:type IV secretion system protein VirB5